MLPGRADRHVKRKYRKNYLPVHIIGLMEDITKTGFIKAANGPLEELVFGRHLYNFLQHSGEICIPIKKSILPPWCPASLGTKAVGRLFQETAFLHPKTCIRQ